MVAQYDGTIFHVYEDEVVQNFNSTFISISPFIENFNQQR